MREREKEERERKGEGEKGIRDRVDCSYYYGKDTHY